MFTCVCILSAWLSYLALQLAGANSHYPRTCHEAQHEGYHNIDPEQDGLNPISVFCNLSSMPVTAVLHHNQESSTLVQGYEDRGSYNAELLYDNGATSEQLRGLILSSIRCKHSLRLRCYGVAGGSIWWMSHYGRVDQWEKLGGTYCRRENGVADCQCGMNNYGGKFDSGEAWNWPLFPLEALKLGDTGNTGEHMYYEIGPLICEQGPGTQRLFTIQSQKRQNAQVTGVENIRTQSECAVSCTQQSQLCVGFNFKRGPSAMCELCSVPHDAPNTAMVTDQLWNHYAIVP